MKTALFLTFAIATPGFAAIPVGTKMSYRIHRSVSVASGCKMTTQIATKEVVGYEKSTGNHLVRLKYLDANDQRVTLDATLSLSDEARREVWGLYSDEEILDLVAHCEDLGGQLPPGYPSLYACDLRKESETVSSSWLIQPGVPFGTVARSVKAKGTSGCDSLLIVSEPRAR